MAGGGQGEKETKSRGRKINRGKNGEKVKEERGKIESNGKRKGETDKKRE